MTQLGAYVANARKAIVNIVGLAGSLLALGLLPKPESVWVANGIAVATVVVHYLTPNADAPGTAAATETIDGGDANGFPVILPAEPEPDPAPLVTGVAAPQTGASPLAAPPPPSGAYAALPPG